MLRKLLALAVALTAVAAVAVADDKKKDDPNAPQTFEGSLACTKCELGETPQCGHCLVAKDGAAEVKYYLKDEGGKEKYHKEVCTGPKDAKVTGKVAEKDGKKYLDKPKVEFVKKS